MGAEPWSCFTKHDSNLQRRWTVCAMKSSRRDGFATRKRTRRRSPKRWKSPTPTAPRRSWTSSESRPSPTSAARPPFSPAELKQFFGSERPSRADIERADGLLGRLEPRAGSLRGGVRWRQAERDLLCRIFV